MVDTLSPNLTMMVNVTPGCSIEIAAEEALHMANQLRCWVEFDFNDVSCYVAPNSRTTELVEQFHEALKDKGPVRHPRRAYSRTRS